MIPRGLNVSGSTRSFSSSFCPSCFSRSTKFNSSQGSVPPPSFPSHYSSTSSNSSCHPPCLTATSLVFCVLLVFLLYCPQDAMGTEYVVGVSGRRAELPCHLLPEQIDDRAILALWYIQGRRLPVYSYDARGFHGLHQPDDVLSGRGSFETSSSPARLILNPVVADDQGVYTCRVDFISSPTHNTVVNLTVIEPPEKLTIYDSEGRIVSNTIGPINEGSPLMLSCIVTGGRPQPTASWWSDRSIIERRSEVTREGHIKTELKIPEVSRAYQEKKFLCQAQNNNQEEPLSEEITIDMNLRPLSVKINIPNDPLIAGQQYYFTCESKGSKPTAVITWFQNSEKIDDMRTQTRSSPGDVTMGELTLVPNQDDHGKILKCQSANPSMSASAISDDVLLNVHYSPVVVLEMGKNLVPQAIKQGDDVYFSCKITANPAPYMVTWAKNSEEVTHDKPSGVILSGNSLVLQNVDRSSAGEYTCSATNTQGSQISNPVRLDIMYPPECMVDHPTVLAVGRGERVNISCRVASNPPRATFNWRLNGSDKTYTSPGERLPWGHLASHYTFLGATDKDYGALFCWANNSIGIQEKPCVFQIIPAGPPSSPEHCEIINNTAENIEVMCAHGFDGGMAQLFLAEVYDEGGSLHLNQSSDEPQFSVESLQPGTTYTIRISAYNAKGRSQPISLTAVTLKVAEQRVGENKSLLYSPLIIIFISIVGVFLIIIVILVSVTRLRKNNNLANNDPSSSCDLTGNPPPPRDESNAGKTILVKEDQDPGRAKPKKKVVVVVENGTKDQKKAESTAPGGLGGGGGGFNISSPDVTSSKDALLSRQSGSQPLANGSAGYYNSLGKTSFPSNFHPSSSTLPRSHRTSSTSSTGNLAQLRPQSSEDKYASEEEDYFPSHTTTRFCETLPRNLGRTRDFDSYRKGGGILRVGGSDSYRTGGDNIYRGTKIHLKNDSYRTGDPIVRGDIYHGGNSSDVSSLRSTNNFSDSGYENRGSFASGRGLGGSGGVDMVYQVRDTYGSTGDISGSNRNGKDNYHLLEDLKNNPKYVVRTRACDPHDESFV